MKTQHLITDANTLEKIRLEVIEDINILMQDKFSVDNFKEEIAKIADEFLPYLDKSSSEKSPPSINLEQFNQQVEQLNKRIQALRRKIDHRRANRTPQEKNLLNSLDKIIVSFKEAIKQVDYYSTHDHVTHLHNRCYFCEQLLAEIARSERHHHEFVLLLIDVDDFKQINDQYGYNVGDKVLFKMANLLVKRLRNQDIVCRVANDEFGIILPETQAEDGIRVAEILKDKLNRLQFYDLKKHRLKCTTSIGVVTYPQDAKTQHYLLLQADNTLKHAKKSGKNKISTCMEIKPKKASNSLVKSQLDDKTDSKPEIQSPEIIFNRVMFSVLQLLKEKEKLLNQVNKIHEVSLKYDPLTELPNRHFFIETLNKTFNKSQKNKRKMALIILGINNFHEINNLVGFELGNLILNIVAKKLKNISNNHFISRLGNDEFGIILDDIKSTREVDSILSLCLNAFDNSLMLNHNEFKLSLTSGISIYPKTGTCADELLQHASTAMHHAKKIKKGGFEYFNERLSTSIRRRHDLEMALMHALSHQEFYLVYQPQMLLKTTKLCGIEALIRWQSERFGLVSPEEFIPIAEQIGLIEQIGRWVLEQSIQDFKKIRAITSNEQLKLAINVSILQLSNPSFDRAINILFKDAGINPKDLILEVTETAIMKEPNNTHNTLERIAKLGVKFSLDDFGIGYSSMRYLKLLPISSLKIDRSFLKGIPKEKNDVAIVKAIISLGVSLDLFVVAEGVETKEQLQFLKDMGCPAAQGFYFAKPLALRDLISFIKR